MKGAALIYYYLATIIDDRMEKRVIGLQKSISPNHNTEELKQSKYSIDEEA